MNALLSVPAAYRWTLTLALVILIIGLSVTPGVPRPDDNLFSWLYAGTPPTAQKVFHIVLYALLAFLWMWSLAGIESTRARLAITLLMTLGLGMALELYQTQVPGRFGTLIDVALNAVGVIIGVLIAVFII